MKRTLSFSHIRLMLLAAFTVAVLSPSMLYSQSGEPADEKAQVADADTDTDDEANAKEEAEQEEEQEVKTLTIGSVAPPLDIENWIHDGDGQFAHVTDFKPNKVYVVEFWATWCPPCISAMPHVVEMQKTYANRGVQIISVSDEPTSTIDRFLKRDVPGMKVPNENDEDDGEAEADDDEEDEEGDDDDEEAMRAVTFDELTSSYCLTSDPDGSTSNDYMRAAGRNGIPCAFIVGKDSHIDWIGHPMSMEEVLEQVVNDSWDRDAFGKEFIEQQKADLVSRDVAMAMRAGDNDKALRIADKFLATSSGGSAVNQMRMAKLQILSSDPSYSEPLQAFVSSLLDDESLNAQTANMIGWTLYRQATEKGFDDATLLRRALERNQDNLRTAGPTKPYILDTVAHLQHALGETEAAIATQKEAVELADSRTKARLQRFLDELTAEPEDDAEKDDDKSDE
ncbi:TlpA disulfide reductase family protein [Novipirellula artificiosorum]|uniref:Thiol-disulfide oxidoreductase ResA n=1 Tax=Novipirellula artificiosorum TaxID=2528016 RepID=A0A5C6DFP0_9BACT|nr:TlpA disulfide reductase family protein [Novipirellula artificiosorum]TWU33789.1 Thiol-disulfide oxidoreductase ResA [Novipirellula artificiosorum]